MRPCDTGGAASESQPVDSNPILDFGIDPKTLNYIGHDLQRPECILAESDGTLWSADARGGVVKHMAGAACRFDVVSVIEAQGLCTVELMKGAFDFQR
jgi:hypothetical protein